MASARKEAKSVLLLEESLEAARAINHARDPQKWLTTVRTFEVGVVVGAISYPLPAILATIQLGPDLPAIAIAPKPHDLDFLLHFLVLVDRADAGRAALRVESDLRLAITERVDLAKMVHGVMTYQSGFFDLDAVRATEGLGAFRVTYGGKFRWTTEAP